MDKKEASEKILEYCKALGMNNTDTREAIRHAGHSLWKSWKAAGGTRANKRPEGW